MNAAAFFTDSLDRHIDQHNQPVEWNLHQGLLALAHQLEEIQRDMDNQEKKLRSVEHIVRGLQ